MKQPSSGILAMTGSCTIWGLSPLLYHQLSHVPAIEILAHRTIWSLVFFLGILAVQGRLGHIRASFAGKRQSVIILIAAIMISVNWYLFIWAIEAGYATQSSMGYYIYPLVSVMAGRVLFGEHLRSGQWGAILLAFAGVCVLSYGTGGAPWIALILAATFTLYGVIKKQLAIGPVVSVCCEVALIAPFALLFLLHSWHSGQAAFGGDLRSSLLLMAAGPLTALPLMLFSMAARRASLATVGLVGYLNPTLQFFCAVVVFAEPFSGWHLSAFIMIWSALALYSVLAWSVEKAAQRARVAAAGSGTTVM